MNVIALSCCFVIGAALFIIRGGETGSLTTAYPYTTTTITITTITTITTTTTTIIIIYIPY